MPTEVNFHEPPRSLAPHYKIVEEILKVEQAACESMIDLDEFAQIDVRMFHDVYDRRVAVVQALGRFFETKPRSYTAQFVAPGIWNNIKHTLRRWWPNLSVKFIDHTIEARDVIPNSELARRGLRFTGRHELVIRTFKYTDNDYINTLRENRRANQ